MAFFVCEWALVRPTNAATSPRHPQPDPNGERATVKYLPFREFGPAAFLPDARPTGLDHSREPKSVPNAYRMPSVPKEFTGEVLAKRRELWLSIRKLTMRASMFFEFFSVVNFQLARFREHPIAHTTKDGETFITARRQDCEHFIISRDRITPQISNPDRQRY